MGIKRTLVSNQTADVSLVSVLRCSKLLFKVARVHFQRRTSRLEDASEFSTDTAARIPTVSEINDEFQGGKAPYGGGGAAHGGPSSGAA